MSTPDLTVISLGAGVQSSTMALMAARGEFEPMPDCAIFADTGWEPKGVYDWLDWLETQLPFPVYRVSHGNIRDDATSGENSTGQRFSSIPFFTEKSGMGRRQCTREYKIDPVTQKVRELLGLEKGQRAAGKYLVELWMGISTDEIVRMKDSRHKWIQHAWPLIDAGMTRHDCLRWMEQRQYPQPAKSSCIGCPYRSNAQWRDMKLNDPVSFADAVEFDAAIRDKGTDQTGQQFIHASMTPLGEVDFSNLEDHGQINWLDECDGMCGV